MTIKLPNVSGIYCIRSIAKPERFYIGSAVNAENRYYRHRGLLRGGIHHSKKLQRHFDVYGESDLVFELLINCKKEELIKAEQGFLDSLKPYFNVVKIAGSMLGFKHSKETNKRNSQAKKGNKYWVGKKHKPESKDKMRKAKLGRKLSLETRKKLSKARIGNKNATGNKNRLGKTFTREQRKKISNSLKRHFSERKSSNG